MGHDVSYRSIGLKIAAWGMCVALIGCADAKDARVQSATEAERPVREQTERSPDRAKERRETSSRPVSETEAQTLVEQWLHAQNASVFAAYEALYAAQFRGVKRSGQRVRRYDRAGWLADRRRMFRRTMQVEALNVTVTSTPGATVIRFEQRWASGTYRDAGPKQLVVVREGGAVRITSEELLASRLEDGRHEAGGDRAIFLVEPGHFVTLSTEVNPEAIKGAPRLHRRRDPVVLLRDVDKGKLSAPLRALVGGELELFEASGKRCRVPTGAVYALQAHVPHFGVREAWDGEAEGAPGPLSASAIAQASWDPHAPTSLVVAIPRDGRCGDTVWARRVSRRASPRFYPRRDLRASDLELVWAAVERAPLHAALVRMSGGAVPPLTWAVRDAEVHVYHPDDDPSRSFIYYALDKGDGCGDASVRYRALFERVGQEVTLRFEQDAPLQLTGVVDVDADGVVELLTDGYPGPYERALWRTEGAAYAVDTATRVPFYDCGC